MTVNHASILRKEWFLSYFHLIVNSRDCSLTQAKDIVIELFFHNNFYQYGKETTEQFWEAYNELAKINN